MNQPGEEPRIIVDDDWKSSVQKEKEELQKKELEERASRQDDELHGMPPASIPVLVTTLATQALANLGHIPDPVENRPVIRKPLARHFIDTISVIETKTAGNLTEDEATYVGETLHQLRMIFVQTPDTLPTSGENQGSAIELP